ncbi:hypothetical protein NDU88_001128 [Pleurodeles waltl]|uniref:Uncharacterized protein n=1 Tax=Pleurodeles waltl TaxID=8319 RepID=A0AAV7WL88_PLEWA|nr:hypothetical protein NDU88_001128 [Pleurodeles waltl]
MAVHQRRAQARRSGFFQFSRRLQVSHSARLSLLRDAVPEGRAAFLFGSNNEKRKKAIPDQHSLQILLEMHTAANGSLSGTYAFA